MNLKRILPFAFVLATAFVAGVLFATLGTNLFGQGDRVGSDLRADTPAIVRGSELAPQNSLEDAFINVTATIQPTVVQIIGRQERSTQQEDGVPPSLREFLGDQFPPFSVPRTGLGSGVIVRSDGYIVTNNHVVAASDKLQVMLHDGSIETAQVLGSDSNSDLAVIKIDRDSLPSAPLGNVNDIRVGQWVLAFGSPLSAALDNTVTAGIVSALGRISEQLANMVPHSVFIQTDAAINRGNSGGPLVNLNGELIGINTAILSPTGINSGIGFAVPVDVVDNVVTQLIKNGRVERGFLGINFAGVSQALVNALGVPPGSAQITGVVPGSAADKAGLTTGQIITKVNNSTLSDYLELRVEISNMMPGEEVVLEVKDGDESRVYTVELGTLETDLISSSDTKARDVAPNSVKELGLTLRTFDAEDFAQNVELEEVPEFAGVIVESIDPFSSAFYESDIVQGDIIVEVDQEPVGTHKEFQRVFNRLDAGESAILKVQRLVGVSREDRSFVTVLTALTKPE